MAPTDWHSYAAAGMPANPPPGLSGVWAKMARAATHRDALVAAAEAYIALPPFRVHRTITGDLVTLRAEPTIEPPVDLALILGDMVQCLRSALDHLTWAFARTLIPDPSPRTQFPIMDRRPTEFASIPQMRDVPEPVREIMEQMQPYQPEHDIGGSIGRELASLRRLSNRDKHRVLLVAERVVAITYVAHNTPEGQESGIHYRQDPEGQWAEIDHPVEPRHGPYDARFEAQVTLVEPDLPWRSGLEGIAQNLYNKTAIAIAAFRGQYDLLTAGSLGQG
ncbi:MAG: hypothetical protein ACREX3_04225 [Gammaproteobacteria bacterium]